MSDAPRCPLHDRALICEACKARTIGALGGKARSAKKTRAVRQNARKPRPRVQTP